MNNSIMQNMAQMGTAPMNPMQAVTQIRQNPAAFLQQAGLSIPQGMTDPQQMVQHLLQSGQVNNQQIQAAQQMLGQFGFR